MDTEVGILDIFVMSSLFEVDMTDTVLADVVIIRDAERGIGNKAFHQLGRRLHVIASPEQLEGAARSHIGSRGVFRGFLQAELMLRDSTIDRQRSRKQPEKNRRVHGEDVI